MLLPRTGREGKFTHELFVDIPIQTGLFGTFFSAIETARDFNNNPTALQFTVACKSLLMRSAIEGGKGNCLKIRPNINPSYHV